MNQNQDELQAAINDITNGNASGDAMSQESAIQQIENSVAGGASAVASSELQSASEGQETIDDVVARVTGQQTEAPVDNVAPEAAMSEEMIIDDTADEEQIESGNGNVRVAPERAAYGDPDLDRVKADALMDLQPLIEKIDLAPEKKFHIYRDIIEMTDDKSSLELAYKAAREIGDERERGEALLFLVEFIDEMGVKMPRE